MPALAAQWGFQSNSWYQSTKHNHFSQVWYRRKLSLGLPYCLMLHHGCLFGILEPNSYIVW